MRRTRQSFPCILGAVAITCAVLAACGPDRAEPSDLATPTTTNDCNEDPAVHGDLTASVTVHGPTVETDDDHWSFGEPLR